MIKPEKLSKEVVDLLILGLEKEYEHSYFYQSVSNWCASNGYIQAAEFFLKESDEEIGHARRFQNYLIDWNVIPQLPTNKTPRILEFKNLLNCIEEIYDNEINLYEEYNDISMKIFKCGDISAFDFMQFYRDAQKSSVTTFSDMLNKLEGVDVNDKFKMLLLQEKLF